MKRRHGVLLFVIVSLSFCLFQVVYVLFTASNDCKCMLNVVQVFLSTCSKHGVSPFLVDPDVLEGWQEFHFKHESKAGLVVADDGIQHFCNRKMVTFAVLATEWPSATQKWNMKLLLRDFKELSFLWTNTTGPHPRLWRVTDLVKQEPSPYHFVFWQASLALHLVIFYSRGQESYMWHAPTDLQLFREYNLAHPAVQPVEEQGRTHVHFPLTAGTYERFDLTTIVVHDILFHSPRDVASFLSQQRASRFLECDAKSARQFYEKYPNQVSDDELEFLVQARQLLALGKSVMENVGIRFWLSSGTCLGWFRQCNLIPYSRDVDFGVWIKDYDERLVQAMLDRGLTLKHRFGKVSDGFELSFVYFGLKLDLFFFYEESDHMWNGGTQAKSGKKFKYTFPKFTLCWTELVGVRVRVPCETLSYIQANYGRNWAEPVRHWDWKSSPSNVREVGTWPEREWPEVIQVFS